MNLPRIPEKNCIKNKTRSTFAVIMIPEQRLYALCIVDLEVILDTL